MLFQKPSDLDKAEHRKRLHERPRHIAGDLLRHKHTKRRKRPNKRLDKLFVFYPPDKLIERTA